MDDDRILTVGGCSLVVRIPHCAHGDLGSNPSNHTKYECICSCEKCLVMWAHYECAPQFGFLPQINDDITCSAIWIPTSNE